MTGRVLGEVSSTCPPKDQHVYKQDPEGKKFETLNRENRAILTPVGDVLCHVDLSTKVTVQD